MLYQTSGIWTDVKSTVDPATHAIRTQMYILSMMKIFNVSDVLSTVWRITQMCVFSGFRTLSLELSSKKRDGKRVGIFGLRFLELYLTGL
jgi:hypothetical protein